MGFDQNGDGKVDLVYAGDLLGKFWKFNLSNSNHRLDRHLDVRGQDASSNVSRSPAGSPSPSTPPPTSATGSLAAPGDTCPMPTSEQGGARLVWPDRRRHHDQLPGLAAPAPSAPESAQGSYDADLSAAATNDMVGKRGLVRGPHPAGVAAVASGSSRAASTRPACCTSAASSRAPTCARLRGQRLRGMRWMPSAAPTSSSPSSTSTTTKLFTDADKEVGGRNSWCPPVRSAPPA